MRKLAAASLTLLFYWCSTPAPEKPQQELSVHDFYKTELFERVQLESVFPDGKTFVDCIPKRPYSEIVADFQEQKNKADFDLKAFTLENFETPETYDTGFETDTSMTMNEHLRALWPVLTRKPKAHETGSSLITLPDDYIVPGGRFREIYYWDSYFTIEGLLQSGQQEMAENMLDNFSFIIDSIGFIPNGNRAYYLGRSQPPFYAATLNAIHHSDRDAYTSYLPYLLKEYRFWMSGEEDSSRQAVRRVVHLPDGAVLNRYWDDLEGPRPESYKEDYELVHQHNLEPDVTYKHLRAGAESGWDYTSRWFADHKNMHTIETTHIIPVDLNALIYNMEQKIAQGYNWQGQLDSAQYFLDRAIRRKEAMNNYLWDEQAGFFVDYNFVKKAPTGVLSLAAAYPLYFNIASKAQAKKVQAKLIADFLLPGGFVTTLNDTGQQWDFPNGWAPLQWITVNGLFNYGYYDEGLDGIQRWLDRNRDVFNSTGKMMEKYNVVDTKLLAGGGEYPLQDGFGWTNGVAIAFQEILNRQQQVMQK